MSDKSAPLIAGTAVTISIAALIVAGWHQWWAPLAGLGATTVVLFAWWVLGMFE